jgi:hypothetical protein
MLAYLYNSDYSDKREPSTTTQAISATPTPSSRSGVRRTIASRYTNFSDAALLINAQMFIIADKYDIQRLKQLAKEEYEEFVPHTCDSSAFVASLKLIYDETLESDRLLKDIAVNMAGKHMNKLVDREEFRLLCKGHGVMAFDIMMASLGRLGEEIQDTSGAYYSRPGGPVVYHGTCSCGYDADNCYC